MQTYILHTEMGVCAYSHLRISKVVILQYPAFPPPEAAGYHAHQADKDKCTGGQKDDCKEKTTIAIV